MYRKMKKYKQFAFVIVYIGTICTFMYSIFLLRLVFKCDFSPRISVYFCFASRSRIGQFYSNQGALRLTVSDENFSLFGMI